MKNLSPPHRIVPGACACEPVTRTCICAPSDLADQLAQLNDAKVRADDAAMRGDTITERHYRDLQRQLATSLRGALEPKPERTEQDIRADMITQLAAAYLTPAPTTEETEDDECF